MGHKTLVFFLTLAALCMLDKEVQAIALPDLNYTLVQSVNPLDGEPSKYYKFSLAGKSTPSSGILLIKRMDGEFTDIPVFIDKEGIIRAPDKQNEAIIGMDGGYAEKFEVLLAASEKNQDAKPLAKCVIIPFPRIVQDDKGHKIELEAASPDGEHFLITGSGFKPNEQITFKSRSCNESGSVPLKIDAQGNFYISYDPAVIGKTVGPFEVTFCGENMQPLKMRHYWGKIAFCKPNEYKTLKNKYQLPEEQTQVLRSG